MDVAQLRAIYTATSADFDRVTDHVQRRLRETQSVMARGGSAVGRNESSEALSIYQSIERGRQQLVESNIKHAERETASVIAGVKQQARAVESEGRASAEAAIALQKQRSAALIAEWRREQREKESESRRLVRAEESLQRQRSAALIAESKREQRERSAETRRAQIEIRRMEAERLRIMNENTRAIEALARREAETRIQQGRRAAAEALKSLTGGALGGGVGRGRGEGGGGAFFGGSVLGFAGAGPFASAVGVGLGLSIFAITSRLTDGARAWVDYASKLENAKIAFSTMLGSTQLADKHLRELQSFALTTPFQFNELIDASQRMQALGFTSEQVIPILRDVGNAVAAAGGGSERLDRVTLALAQMQSKGKVATQELNQLAEAGIGGFKILEQATGKSRAELVKMVEAGEVSSKLFLDAFQKFSQANFGGLMEKQSRTFTGAISNIRDALLTTANTAFEPLFRSISGIADRIATELQSGKPALATAGAAIFDGMIEAAGAAGGNMAASLIENFGRRISDPSEWAAFVNRATILGILDPLFRGIASGVGDIEDLFGIGVPTGPLTEALVIPDLKTPLANLKQQQNEVSESAKKAAEMANDLAIKLAFYGQNTEKAAVQQRLLAIGLEALTSAEGRRAIQLADLIDKQRTAAELDAQRTRFTKDLAAVTEGKYKNAFELLNQSIRDSVIQMEELRFAEAGGLSSLRRFNLGVGATIEGLLSAGQASQFSADQILILRTALESARAATANLTAAQEEAKRKTDLKRIAEQQADLFRSLRGIEVDLSRQLRQIPTDEIQRLAEQLEGLSFLKVSPGGLDLFVEKLRSGALDAQQATALISTAINNAQGDLGESFNKTTRQIINLFLKAQRLSDFLMREEATGRYTQLVEQLQEALIGDVNQTNEARLAKELLKREYDGLTIAQREHLQQLAREVDVAERVRIAEERRLENLREIASDIGRIFSDVFQQIGESSDRFWEGLRRQALRFIGDLQEQVFTGLFESLLTGEARRGTGLAGTAADKVLGLFGVKFSGGDISVANNTKATEANTAAINALTTSMGGIPAAAGVLGPLAGIENLFGMFGGSRASGGPVDVGKVYRIHDNEFFRPNLSGQILNLNQARGLMENQRDEVRVNVAVGQDAVNDLMESHMRTPKGKRAMFLRARANRKVGKLLFA